MIGRRFSLTRQLIAVIIVLGGLILIYREGLLGALLADKIPAPSPPKPQSTHWREYLSQLHLAESKAASPTLSPTPCPTPSALAVRPFSADAPKDALPTTRLIKHAPGWTIFENLYMSGGTLFIVTDERDKWPATRMMTSSGDEAVNTPENIALREPKEKHMSFINPEAARKKWGDRVWIVSGTSVSVLPRIENAR